MAKAQTGLQIRAASRSFSRHPVLRAELEAAFPGTVFNEEGVTFDAETLPEFLDGAVGAVIGLEPITGPVLDQCPSLQIVAKYGVGLDNVDTYACEEHNVTIGWTGGVNRLGVAEMTLCFMIGLSRNILRAGNQLRGGVWEKEGGRTLSGKTIGIIGVGHVGREVIRLLEPFDCHILVNDIIDQSAYYEEVGAIEKTAEEICAEADLITIHTPLDDTTRGMVNDDFLDRMQPHAYLINAARGGIIDQQALKFALTSGTIAGAAIDVFQAEPCDDRELLQLPNLFATPHIGGSAEESVLAMGRSAINNLISFFNR